MDRNHGNQHVSRKADLLRVLGHARLSLAGGHHLAAVLYLQQWRGEYRSVPASTRRRWKCGR